VRAVNELAFVRSYEADIVDRLRANGKALLSLVALAGDEVVGHVLFSPLIIEPGPLAWPVCLLGPLAVKPAHQNQGIGSDLVLHGLDAVQATECSAVFLVGDPAYYGRFGFRPAQAFGVTSAAPLDNRNAFQSRTSRAPPAGRRSSTLARQDGPKTTASRRLTKLVRTADPDKTRRQLQFNPGNGSVSRHPGRPIVVLQAFDSPG
jgi:putative acetyltransferase